MNGLSDVRLTLTRSELDGSHRPRMVDQVTSGKIMAQRWKLFLRRLATRRALLELSDAHLRDIGLTREQARQEALLPFWKL
ncbi:DUF1127 domain-containing protein [Phytopseudomonas dryadis]|uniref:YjiS-like domain-containing protein n=1 Tax=Phytopseudomonas dryadis TaxID=2487520 RepID=A0ABY1Z6K8_9GAMM|nr:MULTISPECIES: DUF1127 domain-containing protein [Pseudomonas]TBV06495.1 hypothetical protein DNK34_11345 [Pseudomonas dryadis]TBV17962.1 hypothetical protein DNK41_11105 [Pseudomonas sp. FRB 230]